MTADLLTLPPLSLYVHIPWCVRKCPYCDFNSHTAGPELPEQAYVKALLADLDTELAWVQGRSLQSIFIGGGTPSLFSAAAIGQLLEGVAERVPFAPDIEITLEANPGTVEQGKFDGFRAAGVNRLSIGIQSFDAGQLQRLGRIHSSAEAQQAVTAARRAGFDNFNLDLMHGLPDQTQAQALDDLQRALALAPTHLSWYQLTIEPNTEFYSKPPTLPPDDMLWTIQEAGQALLDEHGFKQYEVSAYCQGNRPARHNLNYWQFGDYLGIGAGAHGKLTGRSHQIIERRWKVRQPKGYLDPDKPFLAGQRTLTHEELPLEFMLNALRLNAGVPVELFSERTGLALAVIAPQLQQARADGLLVTDPAHIRPTERGRLYLNDLLQYFL